jgi:trans-2,3-dihydro-3-hydroxyanthranilate isomerase
VINGLCFDFTRYHERRPEYRVSGEGDLLSGGKDADVVASVLLLVWQVPVELGDICWMRQLSPTFGETFTTGQLSRVLGLENANLDERFPIQETSTGLPCIVVPLKSLEALRRCRVDLEAYYDLISTTQAKAVLAFSPELYDTADLSARFFADYYGVLEDPATGSANGCLAAYLLEHRYFDTDFIDVRVEQRYEIGRPSLLYLAAEKREGEIRVSVGERCRW